MAKNTNSLLGNVKKGLLFVISAPAGTGKTTLVRMLTQEFSSIIESISYTTRQPRPNENSDRDYHFINQSQFETMLSQNEFLEHASVFGEYYGTSRKDVQNLREKGQHVVLIIDTQGAFYLMKKIEAVFIFLSPPSIEELKKRLQSRKADTLEAIEKRLSWAKRELEAAPHYDYHVVNQDLAVAYEILRSIFIAETHRIASLEYVPS